MSRLARGLAAAALTVLGFPRKARCSPQPTAPEAELRLIESVAGALRDGLDTIRGFSELLAHDDRSGHCADAAGAASRIILESSEDLNRFLANLQDFIRHEQGRLRLAVQRADVAELVEAALSTCRGAAERADVTILARLADGLELTCDPVRMRNAVTDMVLWAAQTADAGSVIELRLSRLPEARVGLSVRVSSELPLGGTPEGLFDPNPAVDGLRSFSLPVARRVALLHSGDLTAARGPGGQTTLHLVLPAERVIRPQRTEACESRAA